MFGEICSELDRKCHCHLVGYQLPNFRSQNVQKERNIQHSTGRLSKSQNQLATDQRDIDIAEEHQEYSSLDQPTVGLPANDVLRLSELDVSS